jgi:hypothetical protein
MMWTSNIEPWLPLYPVPESFTVHVSDVGRRWVVTRPISSLLQVGFGFKRMLWLLPATVDFRSVLVGTI